MQTLQSFSDVLVQSLELPTVLPQRKVERFADDTRRKAQHIDHALRVCSNVQLPSRAAVGTVNSREELQAHVERWAKMREMQLLDKDVGNLTWEGDTAIATAYEDRKGFGIVERNVKRVMKTHVIRNPHLRRLPCAVSIPLKGRRIIDELEKAGLYSQIRILTGDLVGEKEDLISTRREPTAFGRLLGEADRAIIRSIKKIGQMKPTFQFDPAICIGTKVFFLWKL